MEVESPTLSDWELKTYGKARIQIVHCFGILVLKFWILTFKNDSFVCRYIIVKENNKSKKNKKNQSDLIRSFPYRTYREFVKISHEINYGNNNMKHSRNG